MKFQNILIFSLICFVCWSCKTQDGLNTQKEVSTTSKEKALLWEITGNDLDQTSYLFGTIHIIDEADYFLPEGTLSAIDDCDQIVFEIDMKDMSDISNVMPLLQKAFMGDGTTLKDLMSESDYNLVSEHFNKLGMPMFFLEKIKPMFLTVFASGDFNPGDLQSGKLKSYEMEFAEMAESGNKTTGGLETIDFQIGLFDSIPYSDQAQMLIEAIRSSDTEDDQFQEIVSIYKSQDIEAMYALMKTDEGISEYEDILLVQRNQNWIPKMADLMKENSVFFAVGAGHLAGPKGVINLLQKEGYHLKPFRGN